MQKLPEALTERRVTHAQRKGTVPTKERISFYLSNDKRSDNT